MTTMLEKALATIVMTFHKYSGKEGDKFKLSRSELKELLMNELPAFNSKRMDAGEFQKIISDLDHNKDNEVDFQEFTCFLACVTMGFDEFFRGCPKCLKQFLASLGSWAGKDSEGFEKHFPREGKQDQVWWAKRNKMNGSLEEALGVLINTFHKYSGREGDKLKLNKREMRELLLQELPTFVKGKIDEPGFEHMMKKLDDDGDEELDFQEYAVFLALTASLCDEFFRECSDVSNRKM
ncbi:hypothetical protein lerEdw1_002954 [Lerista edwardsae]|nr:hypothetical protein lerEdw1_002954 [Lerista edwardsae]